MSYTKSSIYQEALQLALKIETACRAFPRHELYCLAEQLRRASRSIGANYVEGYVREGRLPNDHRRFLIYSQGSCDETKYWLVLAQHIGLMEERVFVELFSSCERLSKMLTGILKRSFPRQV